MAVNPDTAWPNRHSLFLAATGGGKTQALKQFWGVPKSGARLLAWDPDNDHDLHHFSDRAAFVKAVKAAVNSGKGFRIGWDGAVSVADFEWWCGVYWAILDGRVNTFGLIEELADVSSPAKAEPMFGTVLRRSRKYGGILGMTSQRGAEIPKTAYTQAGIKYVGIHEETDWKRVSALAQVSTETIKRIKPLQFLRKGGFQQADFIEIKKFV